MKLIIINGPNLNLLGKRQPEVYGHQSFESYFEELVVANPSINLEYFQSNYEGALIDKLHECGFSYDGIIINAGGYTHTSVALGDAIAAIETPTIEVHISNIYEREKFRHHSFLLANCIFSVVGEGLFGYQKAINYFVEPTS